MKQKKAIFSHFAVSPETLKSVVETQRIVSPVKFPIISVYHPDAPAALPSHAF